MGCCWALMALSFVAGFMNPLWMAAVGALAMLEKTLANPKPLIYGCGLGLIVAGALVMVRG